MFASRMTISVGCALPAPTQLELRNELLFVNISKRLGKAVAGSPEFRKLAVFRAPPA